MAIDPYLTLIRIEPYDPVADARITIYVASAGDRRITGLNGVVWAPALIEQPDLVMRLFNGDFQAPVEPGAAALSFNMGQVRATYSTADRCNWAGAEVEIFTGQAGDAWPWTSVFKGRVKSFSRRAETMRLTAEVDNEPFEKNVLTDTYAGSGGNEGGSDLQGRVKPLVIGWASNVEPVLIDATNSVYQFSGYGAIEAVTTLYERASAFSASVGDYADYAALVAASIPRGRWGTCLAEGLVRLGAPAYGVITGDVKGHKVGSTTPRLTGAIIDALADLAGVDNSLIESGSLTALDADVPYPINLVIGDQVRWIDAARRLALPCNAQAGVSFGGKFFVMRVTLSGTEEFTLNTDGRSEPLVIEAVESDVSPPYYRTTMGAARNWRVQSADEIAFTARLEDRGAYSSSTTYREGDMVTLPDQSEWLYISTTPSSGNAPPGWPATSDAYWEQITEPAPMDVFEDNMTYTAATEFETAWQSSGAGEVTVVNSNDRGGKAIQLGNNSGDDYRGGFAKYGWLDYAPEDIYEVWFDFEVVDVCPGHFYLGVQAVDRAGNNLSGSGTYCYVALQGSMALGVGRYTARGYMRGTASIASGAGAEATDPASPSPLPDGSDDPGAYGQGGTARIRPMFLIHYPLGGVTPEPGTTILHGAGLRKVDDATVNWTGAWSSSTEYFRNDGVTYLGRSFAAKSKHTNQTPPSSATSNSYWYLVADKGADGTAGAPGAPGADGVTHYSWIAYANAPDGSIDFTTGSPGGRAYIGIADNKTSATESVNPADYTWSQYKGPPTFGLVASSGAVVASNSVIKNTASAAWDEQCYSSEGYRGGAFATFKLSDQYALAGLNVDPTTDASYTSIDYAFYGSGGDLQIWENGSGAASILSGTRTGNEVLRIVYDNKNVTYFVDGSQVRQVAASADLMLYFDSSLYTGTTANRITEIGFGPSGAAGTDGSDGADGSNGAPGADGADGSDGLNVAVVFLFQRAASAPSVPGSTLTYTFSTSVLSGTLGSWAQSAPAHDGNPLWMITAPAASPTATDTIATGEWSTPAKMAEDGLDGANNEYGQRAWTFTLTSPSSPSTGSYNAPTGVIKVYPQSTSVSLETQYVTGVTFGAGDVNVSYKWQYSPDGSSWSDVGSAVTTSLGAGVSSVDLPALSADKTGLTARAAAYFRIVLQVNSYSGGGTRYVILNAYAQGD